MVHVPNLNVTRIESREHFVLKDRQRIHCVAQPLERRRVEDDGQPPARHCDYFRAALRLPHRCRTRDRSSAFCVHKWCDIKSARQRIVQDRDKEVERLERGERVHVRHRPCAVSMLARAEHGVRRRGGRNFVQQFDERTRLHHNLPAEHVHVIHSPGLEELQHGLLRRVRPELRTRSILTHTRDHEVHQDRPEHILLVDDEP
mmetsp:Transcript_20102/g.51189  ORF Transcript_20102/g.51189 Transcript_20102/m.51189 type:complete len:202 (+) Transcript_20102:983-1588(+)